MADHLRGGTPATVVLQQASIAFRLHEFAHDPAERSYGAAAAAALGVDPGCVFKTLLVSLDERVELPGVAASTIAVGIVPVSGQLSLREIAAAVRVKRAEMCDPAVAQRVTGYVVGGISPFGQKKVLPTVIDETCQLYDSIFVSGGKRGFDIEIAPDDLIRALHALVAPIAASR